ncbi:MAG: SpoIIE family protein phosphatase [Ruminococcus sp.]|nr:SpoIIE family protein phosphatase [Ruminococcus sp.]
MEKTSFTKSLAFKTILRLAIIVVVLLLIGAAIIAVFSYANMTAQLRDYAFEAAIKGTAVSSASEYDEDEVKIEDYLTTGKTDKTYQAVLLNLLLINDDYELQRCDIILPYEDHFTYLMSSEDQTPGESLNKEAPYYGQEKGYVTKAMEMSVEAAFDSQKTAKENLYTENIKDGMKLSTCYTPVFDKNGKAVAVFAASYSNDKVGQTIFGLIAELSGLSFVVMLISVLIFYFSIRRHIIKPVSKLTRAVRTMKESVKSRQAVTTDIRTGDEIEELAVTFEDMNKDLIGYIDENEKITAEKQRIDTELNLATGIQAGMLPDKFPAFPDRKDFDIYASMKPAKEVGGDFYDFFLIDENRLGIVMADVSGKGVPAALFMMHSKILLKSYTMMKQTPKAALEEVNRQICEHNPEEMFVTVWLGVLDLRTGMFTAANAGHEKPAVKQADGSFELFKDKHGIVVGYMDGITFKEYELQLTKGAKLFLYTDGVAEATNAQEEQFGTDRMIEALRTAEDKAPKDILAAVDAAVDEFVGEAPQFDDLTMLCIEYNGNNRE